MHMLVLFIDWEFGVYGNYILYHRYKGKIVDLLKVKNYRVICQET